ncbi:MAG TPA: hypothetical protein DHN29_06045 [Cytophagales bacterium]|nr:hypothetical protein [Cytophagales bacterium]
MADTRPYCSIVDVQSLNPGSTYDSTSEPTLDAVKQFVIRTYARVNGIIRSVGYTVPATSIVTTTLNGAVSADDTSAIVDSVTGFTVGDTIRLVGSTATDLVDEFKVVVAISTLTFTLDPALVNAYSDEDEVILIGDGLQILRHANALGAAALAEGANFTAGNPNESSHGQALMQEFNDLMEEIQNVPQMLHDVASITTKADKWPQSSGVVSLQQQNPSDTPETDTEVKAGVEPKTTVAQEL